MITKEMMVNAAITLAVVMVALAVHSKFVAPRLHAAPAAPAAE